MREGRSGRWFVGRWGEQREACFMTESRQGVYDAVGLEIEDTKDCGLEVEK